MRDTQFIYDIAFGFMPRTFMTNDVDRLIYDEEDAVTEMYFITEGIVGVGFRVIVKQYGLKRYSIGKKVYAP
jgi:hypothetical protein